MKVIRSLHKLPFLVQPSKLPNPKPANLRLTMQFTSQRQQSNNPNSPKLLLLYRLLSKNRRIQFLRFKFRRSSLIKTRARNWTKRRRRQRELKMRIWSSYQKLLKKLSSTATRPGPDPLSEWTWVYLLFYFRLMVRKFSYLTHLH